MWEALKKRWNVKSGWEVAIILIVFACTGFSVMYVKRALYAWIGLGDDSSVWLRWLVAIVVILPLYQVLLLMWGWLWGKFDFFWMFEKKMIARLSGLFRNKT
jgi:hypothetical protein